MEQLSKKKYIHHLYISNDLILHHEKYPIVYSNSEYIYYKKPGNPELERACTRDVSNRTFDDCMKNLRVIGHRLWFNAYLWEVSGEDLQRLKDTLKNSCHAEKVALKLIDLKRMEAAAEQYNEMANIIKKELYDMGVTNYDQS